MKTAEQKDVEIGLLAKLLADNQPAFKHLYNQYHMQLLHKTLQIVHFEILADPSRIASDYYEKLKYFLFTRPL